MDSSQKEAVFVIELQIKMFYTQEVIVEGQLFLLKLQKEGDVMSYLLPVIKESC